MSISRKDDDEGAQGRQPTPVGPVSVQHELTCEQLDSYIFQAEALHKDLSERLNSISGH